MSSEILRYNKIRTATTLTLDNLPVSVEEVAQHLRLPLPLPPEEELWIKQIILAVTCLFENYTSRILLNSTYDFYFDRFPILPGYNLICCPSSCIALRLSPLIQVDAIEYEKDNVSTLLPSSEYRVTITNDFPMLYPTSRWPQNIDCVPQAVKITAQFGMGATAASINPAFILEWNTIIAALLQYITALYTNRGDCECDASELANSMPAFVETVFSKFKVWRFAPQFSC